MILKELIELAGDLYEFHIVGEIHPCLRGLGVAHGRYARSELPAILTKIGPSVGLILSIWPETYCHTLTELWASGIPVIAFDIGAVGDRLRETPGGWLVKEMTPEGVANALALATSDSRAFSASLQAVKNWQAGLGSEMLVSAMAANYVALYRREERRGTIAMRERLG